ncbi:MAG: SpoVG family protein [Clostridia bacterium]|nr:SpoVG family protein [Clostridia bacterium]
MQITEVRLKKIKSEGNMKAVASITFDGCFVIHDVKVIERKDKPLLVVMPETRRKNGTKSDVAHPINQETRDMITNEVLKKYDETPDVDDAPAAPVEE